MLPLLWRIEFLSVLCLQIYFSSFSYVFHNVSFLGFDIKFQLINENHCYCWLYNIYKQTLLPTVINIHHHPLPPFLHVLRSFKHLHFSKIQYLILAHRYVLSGDFQNESTRETAKYCHLRSLRKLESPCIRTALALALSCKSNPFGALHSLLGTLYALWFSLFLQPLWWKKIKSNGFLLLQNTKVI